MTRTAALRVASGLAAAVALVFGATEASAQAQRAVRPATIDDGQGGGHTIRTNTGFNLFANADLAGTGMKPTGEHGWGLSNIGPCSDGFQLFECGDIFKNGTYWFNWFELNFLAGVGPHDYNKVRAAFPGASNVRAPAGYSAEFTAVLVGGPVDWGPADGSLGRLFSGVVSTDDGSCRDNTSPLNGWMTTGVSLLAGSTCPETWAGGRFGGPRLVKDSAFMALQQRETAAGRDFQFDFFRIAPSEATPKLLGNFSTYGKTTDYFAERIAAFGNVTNIGPATPPTISGFPLGLEITFEAWTFAFRPIANAIFYNMIVVNKSAEVYGTGVDYDSLYMGLQPGWGSGQRNAVYHVPSQNAVKVNESGTNPACNGAIVPPGVVACGSGVPGFTTGAKGIVMLKSPIGDMRNKLLNRSSSPFYDPTNPNVDDTITVNHGHMCSFGAACYNTTYLASEQRAFGMISSTRENVLGGRAPASLTPATAWTTFRNKNFLGVATDATTRFNTWVPGGWDYNDDGVPDTLFFDSCADVGCVDAWADTMPGKQVNTRANVGASFNAGPFSLRAGDTTAFVFALVGAPDSAQFEQLISDVTNVYLGFYAVPEPPPPPRIVAREVASAEVRAEIFRGPVVTLFYSSEPETFVDEFLASYAANLRAEADPTFTELNRLNPDLADAIEARAQQNFQELWIFKSCDDGQSFTADANCDGEPAVGPDGQPIGLGWRPYRIVTPDASGNIENQFTDVNVTAGRTYLYSFVTVSRGFTTPVVRVDPSDNSAACQADVTACRTIATTLEVAPVVTSALNRSGESVAKVYVPISVAAGTRPATAQITTLAGNATVPVGVRFAAEVPGGNYRLIFGDRFIVRVARDTATDATTTTVIVQDVLNTAVVDGSQVTSYVVRVDSTATDGRIEINGQTFSPTDTIIGGVEILTDTLVGLGFVLAIDPGTATEAPIPLFLSFNMTPEAATPANFAASPNFPGFFVELNQALGNTLAFERIIQANGDTVSTGIMNSSAVQLQDAPSRRRSEAASRYVFTAAGDFFGPQSPFTLANQSPAQVRSTVDASLRARPAATTGVTDTRFRDIIAATIPSAASRELIPAQFNFTVSASDSNTSQVFLAMFARSGPRQILLGSGSDTVSVTVPDSVYVPGDSLYILEVRQHQARENGDLVFDASGNPVIVTDTILTFGPVVLGCNSVRVSCNPLRFGTPGAQASAYLPYSAGDRLVLEYPLPLTSESDIRLTVTPNTADLAQLTSRDLAKIRVVPNPFVFYSEIDEVAGNRLGEPRIVFAGVPARGTLRIYSVSGQFLQQLTWTEADLNGTGDLPWNLITREGTELASGLYIYVVTADGTGGRKVQGRGKFVVIR